MDECKHEFVFQETIRNKNLDGQFDIYTKIDVYFCKYCLEQKEIKKEQTSHISERRGKPEWY